MLVGNVPLHLPFDWPQPQKPLHFRPAKALHSCAATGCWPAHAQRRQLDALPAPDDNFIARRDLSASAQLRRTGSPVRPGNGSAHFRRPAGERALRGAARRRTSRRTTRIQTDAPRSIKANRRPVTSSGRRARGCNCAPLLLDPVLQNNRTLASIRPAPAPTANCRARSKTTSGYKSHSAACPARFRPTFAVSEPSPLNHSACLLRRRRRLLLLASRATLSQLSLAPPLPPPSADRSAAARPAQYFGAGNRVN